MLIPDKYINSIAERMTIYGEMNKINNETELDLFKGKLVDRFGRIPKQVDELLNGVRIKWLAKQLGMERIIFKNRTLKCYFVESPQSAFYESTVFHGIMNAVQQMGKGLSMKQAGKHLVLTMDGIISMQHAFDRLAQILAVINPVIAPAELMTKTRLPMALRTFFIISGNTSDS
jgi:transcription-repair coupling factor (superfamily II helicase)